MLLRSYDVDAGRVRLNGVDVADLTQSSLRTHTAVVPQDTVLFNGSIRSNIAYGRPGASEAEVEAAARKAQLDEAVRRMPQVMKKSEKKKKSEKRRS